VTVFLTSAVALTALLALFNFAITLAVLRRLRDFPSFAQQHSRDNDLRIRAPGEQLDRDEIDSVDLRARRVLEHPGDSLFAFFTDSCSECSVQAPAFLDLAASRIKVGRPVVAIVSGPQAHTFITQNLPNIPTVLIEDTQGPLHRSFGVWGFPAFCTVEGYRMVTSGHAIERGGIVA
jgi:peroxiredoxin